MELHSEVDLSERLVSLLDGKLLLFESLLLLARLYSVLCRLASLERTQLLDLFLQFLLDLLFNLSVCVRMPAELPSEVHDWRPVTHVPLKVQLGWLRRQVLEA